jgi:hypothetical protein
VQGGKKGKWQTRGRLPATSPGPVSKDRSLPPARKRKTSFYDEEQKQATEKSPQSEKWNDKEVIMERYVGDMRSKTGAR